MDKTQTKQIKEAKALDKYLTKSKIRLDTNVTFKPANALTWIIFTVFGKMMKIDINKPIFVIPNK